jgi:hypothetical protein
MSQGLNSAVAVIGIDIGMRGRSRRGNIPENAQLQEELNRARRVFTADIGFNIYALFA